MGAGLGVNMQFMFSDCYKLQPPLLSVVFLLWLYRLLISNQRNGGPTFFMIFLYSHR